MTTPPLFNVEKHHSDAEIAERLFTLPDPNAVKSEVSNAWGWFSSATTSTFASLASSTASNVNSLTTAVVSLNANVASVASDMSQSVAGLSEGNNNKSASSSSFELPWAPLDGPNSVVIREKILALSKDDNTFLVPPPTAAQAQLPVVKYNFATDPEPATKMLEADPVLGAKRFLLVPKKIEEKVFWANYFYRVQLIKDSFGSASSSSMSGAAAIRAGATAAAAVSTSAPQTNSQAETASKAAPAAAAVVSAAAQNKALEEESLRTELALATETGHVKGGSDQEENFEMLDDDELLAGVETEDVDE